MSLLTAQKHNKQWYYQQHGSCNIFGRDSLVYIITIKVDKYCIWNLFPIIIRIQKVLVLIKIWIWFLYHDIFVNKSSRVSLKMVKKIFIVS